MLEILLYQDLSILLPNSSLVCFSLSLLLLTKGEFIAMSSLAFCDSSLSTSHLISLHIVIYLTLFLWSQYYDYPDSAHGAICLLSHKLNEMAGIWTRSNRCLPMSLYNITGPDVKKQIFFPPQLLGKWIVGVLTEVILSP